VDRPLAATPGAADEPQATSPPSAAAAPTGVMRDFEPIDGKARVAIVLLALSMAGAALRVPLLFDRAASTAALRESNSTLIGLSTFSSLVFVGAIIAFAVWFKAAYDNLGPFGATNLRYTPGWAIGGWFIPIANLFIPKQIANDIWRASDPNLPVDQGERWKLEPKPALLNVWWMAWILRGILSVTAAGTERVAIRNGDIEGVKTAVRVAAVSEMCLVVAGVALIVIIRNVTARQSERAHLIAASSPERARALGLTQ
jgi:uncharacterized protein DUF4328